MRLKLLALVTSTVAVGVTLLGATPAAAADTTVTADVRATQSGTSVGTATFTRTAEADGTETLLIQASTNGDITASHVCLSDTPFTSRVSAGSCPYQQGATGSSVSYQIDLGSAYAGQRLYVQFHLDVSGETAFAGWQDGNPFYGNVEVPAVSNPAAVPAGSVGALGLAALLGLVMVLGGALWRWPHRRALAVRPVEARRRQD